MEIRWDIGGDQSQSDRESAGFRSDRPGQSLSGRCFAAGKGGGEDAEYGFKGKGVTIHALVDGNGNPLSVISAGAAGSGRSQIDPLTDNAAVMTGKVGRPGKLPEALQADKGYDSRELRERLRRRGITPHDIPPFMAESEASARQTSQQTCR